MVKSQYHFSKTEFRVLALWRCSCFYDSFSINLTCDVIEPTAADPAGHLLKARSYKEHYRRRTRGGILHDRVRWC